jgi:hypothetical protein
MWKNLLRKAVAQKRAVLPVIMMIEQLFCVLLNAISKPEGYIYTDIRKQSVRENICKSRGPGVRFPALPDFLRSSGSGTGSTQPREDS